MLSDLFADLVRGAHYASVVSLFGCFAFLLAVARPAWRAAGADASATATAEAAAVFERFLFRLAAASLAAALASGFLWLWVVGAGMSGRPLGAAFSGQLFGTVLTLTEFGRLWLFRAAAAILLALFLVLWRWARRPLSWHVLGGIGGLLAGAVLGSLGPAGHGADDTGAAGIWHLGADILHLLAAGGWLGALAPLVFVLRHARRPGWLPIAREATLRFSTLGVATVAILVATGLVNTWYLAGNVPALVGTPYGRLLLVKLVIFAGMLSLAAVNRARLTPRLAGPAGDEASAAEAARRLARNAACEAALAVVLLLTVGALVHLRPGLHDQPVWPFPIAINPAGVVLRHGARLVLDAAIGIAALSLVGLAVAIGRRRWLLAVASVAAVAAAGAISLRPFVVEAYPTSYIHSPIRYGALSVARGQPLYADNCALCHGPYGYGDGPAAAALPMKPANLTGEHLFHHGEGTLFWWVSHGISGTPMPAFADRLNDNQRWDLLNFLRAQADAERASTMTADDGAQSDVVAPDFAFQIGAAPQETLTQQRGRYIVLLVLFSDPGSLPRLREIAAALPQLRREGVRVIALPMTKGAGAAAAFAVPGLPVADSDPGTVAAYSLFRRTPSVEGVPPMPSHMEFLIDRSGYLRYRWSPVYGAGWDRVAALESRIGGLNREPARPPAPEGHVH